ncbi:hypothetical protein V8C42DRAFT_322596 [Trichoderma barbatum]
MGAQSTEFPQFALLPPEIRLQIWFYCLPHRSVQRDDPLEYPYDVRNQQKCWSRRPTGKNAAPPLIASVCRESRQVVREWGKMVLQDFYFNIGPIWIQPRLDGYHLNCDDSYFWNGDEFYLIDEFFDEGFYRLNMMPVSLKAEFFFPFYMDPEEYSEILEYPLFEIQEKPAYPPNLNGPYNLYAKYSKRPWKRVSLSVTLTFICIHVTTEQAADSGLFGLLLDAPVQLVDYDDEKKLRAFHALFQEGHSNYKRLEVSKLFDTILAPGFHSDVESWREKADWLIMAHAWRRAKKSKWNSLPIDGDSNLVWTPPLLEKETKILMNITTESQANIHAFDEHHPWVIQTKKELPKLTPKIQFLLCTDGCDVDGNIGMVRELPTPRSGPSDFHRTTRLYADLSELP